MRPARLHHLEMTFLNRCKGPSQLHQQRARESENGVQWGAQLVTHARKERILCRIGLCQFLVQPFELSGPFPAGSSELKMGSHASQKFPRGERLYEVIVCARIHA